MAINTVQEAKDAINDLETYLPNASESELHEISGEIDNGGIEEEGDYFALKMAGPLATP